MLGRNDEALAHSRAAIEIDEATGASGWAAYAKTDLAELLARRGDAKQATALLDEVAATAAELGMTRLAVRRGAISSGF